ncbi:MAG TPA: enolase C-terminal domain-like protein [Solirubrobacteraceae bacterium]|nr:enolase C-terminal domain-like protein [Solirubrobacteraceae bacterium]
MSSGDSSATAATRVTELACFRTAFPAEGGTYRMSGGREYTEFSSTVVRVSTEDGTRGYGEASTMGGDYLDGFLESTEATVRRLAPLVLDADPLQAAPLVRMMDRTLIGHFPGKAAIDIAMWDLRGRLLGVPVATLLGGIAQTTVPAFAAVPPGAPEERIAEARRLATRGYLRWQIKVGDAPDRDVADVRAILETVGEGRHYLSCDANCGWTTDDAMRFSRAVADLETYLEQPCASISELALVRAATGRPIIIDEAAKQPRDLLDAIALGCVDGINLKPVRVGGLTKAALMRDIAQSAGLKIAVDEPMGGMLASACVAQLAATVDPRLLLASAFFATNEESFFDERSEAEDGMPTFSHGEISVPTGPGHGVIPDEQSLGDPVFVVDAETV